jgi:hypothetical protein
LHRQLSNPSTVDGDVPFELSMTSLAIMWNKLMIVISIQLRYVLWIAIVRKIEVLNRTQPTR